MNTISCIMLTHGRPDRLEEAIESYRRQQCRWPTELVVVNTGPQQRFYLKQGLDSVAIHNLFTRPDSLGQARNIAVNLAVGTHVAILDDDDLALPNLLDSYAVRFEAQPEAQWVWLNKQFYSEGGRIVKISEGMANTFAFTKQAWLESGTYRDMNCGEDRDFIGRVTKSFPGVKAEIDPKEIAYIYCWNNGVHHISGLGDDKPLKPSSWDRAEADLERRIRSGAAKRGHIELTPRWRQDYEAKAAEFLLTAGWTATKQEATAVVLLGKNGDVINILPVLKKMADAGEKPHLVVAREFAAVLDGVSYVTPVPLDVRFDQLFKAMDYAKARFTKVVRAQIFGAGHNQEKLTSNFNLESWREAGMQQDFHNAALKPLFDRRDKVREQALIAKSFVTRKPKIITNLTMAGTAPLDKGPLLLGALKRVFSGTHEIVEVGRQKMHRIYDLLALMERADLIVTIDTATLHLAAATNVPVIALLPDNGWGAATVRYNLAQEIRYSQASPDVLVGAVRTALAGKLTAESERIGMAALSRPLADHPRVDLRQITLWACCWSNDRRNLNRTLRVLRYCRTLFDFGEVMLFSFMAPGKLGFKLSVHQIPKLDMASWNIFHNRVVPHYIKTEFAMSVHEDGFPLDPKLWQPAFLYYDFIGAPWVDGVVGNSGFCIESRKFMSAKLALPFAPEPVEASDMFVCRRHRSLLDAAGVKFAPLETALEFSTEQTGARWPSFGFHGRRDQPKKYAAGWKLIEESERV